MYNEKQRKITSITLMAIMVAGGMTFAIPGIAPVAHAQSNPNLTVSAENSEFDNYMVGPQVIEVVVNDSDIKDTDDANGEPDVTVNGKILRMAQAVDGQWYGYFADRTQAENADSTTNVAGSGLDFGTICTVDGDIGQTSIDVTGVDMSDTVGFALGTAVAACDVAPTSTATNYNNVLREAKALNENSSANSNSGTNGQIGVVDNAWPFIQLYDLNPTGNVNIQYNKGGGAQSTTLTFDTVEGFAGLELDRQTYPLGAQVHLDITDTWLNIDPTDEDSWTFNTDTGDPYYQVFDENGRSGGTAINIGGSLGDLMCDTNCKLLVGTNDQNRPNPVITIQDNDDSDIATNGDANDASSFYVVDETQLGAGSAPVTITESGPNTGFFRSYDEGDKSVLAITTTAQRGTSGSIDYNESPRSVLAGFDFATIDIQPVDDEWSSGEEIPFILTDEDQNKNSHVDEDLILSDPDVTLIPALSTGDPFTIGEGSSELNAAYYTGNAHQASATVKVDDFSQIARVTAEGTGNANLLVIDLETTAGELRDTISDNRIIGDTDYFRGYNLLNYDIRSLEQRGVTVLLVQNNATIVNGTNALTDTTQFLALPNDVNADQDLILLDSRTTTSGWSSEPDRFSGIVPETDRPEITDPVDPTPTGPVPITTGAPIGETVDSSLSLAEGVRITEITVNLGTRAGFGDGNNVLDIPLAHLFGDGVTAEGDPIDNPALTGVDGTSASISVSRVSGDDELQVYPESDGTFDITYTLADESTHTIKVNVVGGVADADDASATVTKAERTTGGTAPANPAPSAPTVTDITASGTVDTTITQTIDVTNVPSGYTFTSVTRDSALTTAGVSISGTESGGTITVSIGLPSAPASAITGNIVVTYGDGTNTLTSNSAVSLTVTSAPTPQPNPPTVTDITASGTVDTTITQTIDVTNVPSGYTFTSVTRDSALTTAGVSISGTESGGTITVSIGLPSAPASAITGNIVVTYGDGTNTLTSNSAVSLTVNPAPFTIADITVTGTSGSTVTHVLEVSNVPTGYSFTDADFVATSNGNNGIVTASGADSSGMVTITFTLATVSESTEIDGFLHVDYDSDTNTDTLTERVPAAITIVPNNHPIGATVDRSLQLAEGVKITEITVQLGTSASTNDLHTIPVEYLFGEQIPYTGTNPDLNGHAPASGVPPRGTGLIGIGGSTSVIVLHQPIDGEFTITATLADGTSQMITVKTESNQATTRQSATVTGANDPNGTPITEASGTATTPTIQQIIADLIPSMTPAYAQDTTTLGEALYDAEHLPDNANIGIAFLYTSSAVPQGTTPIAVDFFSFGFTDDGVQASERTAHQIIRIEAEETDDNTSTFAGSLEYVMVNQINIMDPETYTGISPIADDPSFIVIEDLTDEDAPRVTYADLGADGVITPVSDQEEAPSHSGIVTLNQDSYKVADTVEVELIDADLNVNSDLVEVYTVVNVLPLNDTDNDQVGANLADKNLEDLSFGSLGRLLDITFDDVRWATTATCGLEGDTGLGATGFTLRETGPGTGIFTGDFQIPANWCRPNTTTPETTTGLDIEVNYVDFRDASGEIIEVGDSAGVRANTGSVSLDRTVYPVPFGVPADFETNNDGTPDDRSVFPIHAAGIDDDADADLTRGLDDGEYLTSGDLTIHIRVNDPDFDVNPSGEDEIAQNVAGQNYGPVKISVERGASTVILGYAGGNSTNDGRIGVGDSDSADLRQFGPISEIAPDAGIYELDMTIRFTDGPADTQCPNEVMYESLTGNSTRSVENRFSGDTSGEDFCILQGDILQVEYTDPTDASGDQNTVTDSATFDLRNGVLQADKSVYIIGSDMILTLIEPDLDLDNDAAETYDLDLIEWDSDAGTVSMGNAGGEAAAFDPEPTDLRETGDSTGVFQIVIEIPQELDGDKLERGEEIVLEYTDWGPSGSDYVGDEDEDINWTLFTSNFGATVELDQKVYTWTDKVYITIVAPDHNFDGDLVDEIGDSDEDPIKVSTRGFDLDGYKLVETGTDTGIFTGEVILTGFTHDADGDTTTGTNGNDVISTEEEGSGPTDGKLPADDDDGITVSFEFSENETVVGSALIRWNIGEVQWLEASYPATGTGIVRVIDPDMNLDPEAVDNFSVDAWSDSDAGGVDLTVTETNEATGIFEGTVFFTVTDESTGHRLRVAEGDTVTAEYEDNTLPDPHTTADELDITATSLIGTIVPPLERAPASNLRTVDAFGNTLDSVMVDQQVQITADLANGQDREQAFAYLVQIQNSDGVTASLAWITGSLSAGQSFSPALSWTPDNSGEYTVTAFVWESVDNPTALSPPITTTVQVN